MIPKKIKVIASVGLALGVAFGGARLVKAQIGGGGLGGFGVGFKADAPQTSYVTTNSLVGVETAEKDGVKVYRIEDGTWYEYRAPKGTRVRPYAGGMQGGYIAIGPEGPKITQLAAFSDQSKSWVTLDLKEPVEGKLVGPILGWNMAVYVAGHRVYAFSGQVSKWGVLELPEGAEPRPMIMPQIASVLHGDRIYLFNPKFGRWDDSGDRAK